MKKILTLLILTTFCISAFSQKKPEQPPKTAGTSDILKTDKWIENFKIKKEKFNVYLGYQDIEPMIQQIKGDTLEVYKITFDKRKSSEMEFTKYATINGKIIREGFYKIENDTLTVISNSYNYIGAFKTTIQYSVDKYGFFKVINENSESIDRNKLSDKYLKLPEVNVPPPAKN